MISRDIFDSSEDLDRPVQLLLNFAWLLVKKLVKIPLEQNDLSYIPVHINSTQSCPIEQLSAETLNILPRRFLQIRVRRNDVQHGLHIAVGVIVVDDLFEIERA